MGVAKPADPLLRDAGGATQEAQIVMLGALRKFPEWQTPEARGEICHVPFVFRAVAHRRGRDDDVDRLVGAGVESGFGSRQLVVVLVVDADLEIGGALLRAGKLLRGVGDLVATVGLDPAVPEVLVLSEITVKGADQHRCAASHLSGHSEDPFDRGTSDICHRDLLTVSGCIAGRGNAGLDGPYTPITDN